MNLIGEEAQEGLRVLEDLSTQEDHLALGLLEALMVARVGNQLASEGLLMNSIPTTVYIVSPNTMNMRPLH